MTCFPTPEGAGPHLTSSAPGRIRGLDGREASLQGEGEHRAVSQLVQAVIVVPKLLHQHSPPGQVQKVLEESPGGRIVTAVQTGGDGTEARLAT